MIEQYVRDFGMAAAMNVLAMFSGCLAGGCAMFDPGGSVRRGLEQAKIYEWREDGSFWVEGVGTQAERFTMIEGVLVMKGGEDGPVVDLEKSIITHYLTADPSAKVAGTAMGQALAASTEQIKASSQLIGDLVSTIVPLISPVPGPE